MKGVRLQNGERTPERRYYVKLISIRITVTKVTITIGVGDETLVIEVPINKH